MEPHTKSATFFQIFQSRKLERTVNLVITLFSAYFPLVQILTIFNLSDITPYLCPIALLVMDDM